jgi:hypothetical protein
LERQKSKTKITRIGLTERNATPRKKGDRKREGYYTNYSRKRSRAKALHPGQNRMAKWHMLVSPGKKMEILEKRLGLHAGSHPDGGEACIGASG